MSVTVKSTNFDAPAIGQRVFEFTNNGNLPPYVIVENQGSAASLSFKFQESDDGVTYTDIAVTTRSINPGQSDGQIVISSRRKLALFASGNVRGKATLVFQQNGSPSDLGGAI